MRPDTLEAAGETVGVGRIGVDVGGGLKALQAARNTITKHAQNCKTKRLGIIASSKGFGIIKNITCPHETCGHVTEHLLVLESLIDGSREFLKLERTNLHLLSIQEKGRRAIDLL